jgi:fructose 1,6-bisphosphatase
MRFGEGDLRTSRKTAISLKDAKCTAFDGPPRIVALGFQVADGQIAEDDGKKPVIVDLF